MKLPLDPSHFEVPISLATCIFGEAVSALGIVAVNRFIDALNYQAQQIAELIGLQTKRVQKLEMLSLDALRDAAMQAINTIIHHKS